MHDPVVLSDGHTYEKRHIERWLHNHSTSPVSNEELPQKAIFPNHALRNAIEEYFEQVFSVHRQAIRKTIRGRSSSDLVSNEPLICTIDALMRCSFLMNADLSTECVLRSIMDQARNLLGAEAASVFLVDAAKQELYSTVNSTGGELRIPITAGIAGHVATTGEALVIADAYSDERFNRENDLKTGFTTRNMVCVPLKLKKGAVIGVVQLINKSGTGAFCRSQALAVVSEEGPSFCLEDSSRPSFTPQDLQFMQVFATQAAIAVAGSGGVLDDSLSTGDQSPKDAVELKKHSLGEADKEVLKETILSPRFGEDAGGSVISEEVAVILQDAFIGWQFDAIALAALTDNRPLSTLGMYLFTHLDLVQSLDLDIEKLRNFFTTIEDGYDDSNPYHNRAHAASVMQAMHALLQHGGIVDVVSATFAGEESCIGKRQSMARVACLVAAAMHDHEHLGLTNEFLVRSGHSRAMLYNDQHVNEHHHVASGFAVLLRPECNFLDGISTATFSRLRNIAIELILGTDMANGGKIQKSFTDVFLAPVNTNSSPQSESLPIQDAMVLLQMAMKIADLGHLALGWDVHMKWVLRLEKEFFAQGDKEKALGHPVSFLMDRDQPGCSKTQVGFFQFVVLPLFQSFVAVVPAAQPMLDAINHNYECWQQIEGNMSQQVLTAGFSSRSSDNATSSMDGKAKPDEAKAGRKRSGRARQRAAKWWSTVRQRTPSPEPVLCHHLIGCQ
jgi:cAMP-specific phosphodiesterase 4